MPQVHLHASFCYVWISLERNAYAAPYVINISFIIVVSKFISVIEMQELVIVKDLSYFGVRNVLQEKNPDTERIFERSARHFCTSTNIRNQSNLNKEEFQKMIFCGHLKCLLFMEIIVFQKGFGKDHPSNSAFWIKLLSL